MTETNDPGEPEQEDVLKYSTGRRMRKTTRKKTTARKKAAKRKAARKKRK